MGLAFSSPFCFSFGCWKRTATRRERLNNMKTIDIKSLLIGILATALIVAIVYARPVAKSHPDIGRYEHVSGGLTLAINPNSNTKVVKVDALLDNATGNIYSSQSLAGGRLVSEPKRVSWSLIHLIEASPYDPHGPQID